MLARKREDIIGNRGDASGDRWHNLPLLHEEGGIRVICTFYSVLTGREVHDSDGSL